MTKYKILIFGFLPLCIFGDCADCEAYKTQVASDCDSIISSCDSAIFDCQTAASSAQTFATYYGSNTTERAALIQVAESASRASGTLVTLKTFAQSIKSTVHTLQCSSSSGGGSCDCAQYLQSLISLLVTCNQTLLGVSSGLNAVRTTIGDIDPANEATVVDNLRSIEDSNAILAELFMHFFEFDQLHSSTLYRLSDFYNLLGSFAFAITNAREFVTFPYDVRGRYITTNNPKPRILDFSYWDDLRDEDNEMYRLSLYELLFYGIRDNVFSLASLNNYGATNLIESVLSRQYLTSINTNIVSLSSKFSIFNDFVFSAEAPLSMYTDRQTDGSYHDYLTNYYIKVSKGQQSGSDNFTNWFSRIEILLASLVFQDDGTNFVEEADNTSQMENTLSQSVDTLSQAVSIPQNVTGKIDNMGQSFLGLLGEWRTIVNGNSLPSQFVLCDINLGSQSRDSSAGSSVSSFRLETSLDSGEFRQFLDFCHAITTILFTMLFVWLSIMLLSFLLASLAKLAQFCYMVYSALFGG